MEKLRVGIVGCGEVTQIIHLPSLDQLHDRFAVTALCDVSPAVLEAVGDAWRISHRFGDHRALIEQADVDVVLVANPHAYHAEVVQAALDAGKHVLVEKPMCLTLREADEVIAAQRRHPELVVQVGTMRRYAPAFVAACDLLPELGPIRLARVHGLIGWNKFFIEETARVVRGGDVPGAVVAAGRAREAALLREAVGDVPPALSNAYSLLLGLSIHDLSAMRELLGMPVAVLYAAQRQNGRYLSAAFDYGDYICHFETGIDNIPRFDAHLEVYGEERVLRVQYDTPYVRNLPIRLVITEANGRGGAVERVEHPAWGDAFVAEWLAFHDNVRHGRAAKSSPADFRQDLELFQQMIAAMT